MNIKHNSTNTGNSTYYGSMGKLLKTMRKEAGLSIKDLAKLSGVSYATIQRIESNATKSTIDVMYKLSEALGHTLKVGLTKEGEVNNPLDNRNHNIYTVRVTLKERIEQ